MRIFAAILAGLCLAASATPAAAQRRCAAAAPAVRLDFSPSRPALGTMPLDELRRLSRAGLGDHAQTLGLYKAELHPSMSLDFAISQDGNSACIALRHVTLDVRFAERRIFIARELKRGSCRHDTTLAHEERHAQIDDTILARELPRLKQAVARAAAENGAAGPFAPAQLQVHRDDIGERLQRIFRQEIDRIGELRRAEQGTIDTPDSYRRDSERCPGE